MLKKKKTKIDLLADKITDNIIKDLRDLFGDVNKEATENYK